MVDPLARTIAVLVLDGDTFHERLIVSGSDPVVSPLLTGASFPASAVFAGPDDLDPAPSC